MAATKRTKIQVENEREKIASWYLKGWTLAKIGNELGLSPQMIHRELKIIQKRWREDTSMNLDDHKAKVLAETKEIRLEAWKGWDRSQQKLESQTTTIHAVKIESQGKEQIRKTPVNQVNYTENRTGDPRFLDQVNKALERECKLLGLDKLPDQQQPLSGNPLDNISALPKAQRLERLHEIQSIIAGQIEKEKTDIQPEK